MQAFKISQNLKEKFSSNRVNILNFFSYVLPKIISLSLYAVSVPFFINRVGEKAYGILTLILLVFSYLYILDFGLGYAITYRYTRKLAIGSSAATAILSKGVLFYIVSSLFFGLALMLFSDHLSMWFFNSMIYANLFKLASICCFFLMMSYFFTGILASYNCMYLTNASNLVLDLIRNISLILGAIFHGNLFLVVSIIIFGTIVKLMMDLYFVLKKVGTLTWMKPVYAPKELIFNLKLGSPMLIVLAFAILANCLGKVFVGHTFGLKELAYYSIALDLNMKAYFLIAAVNGTISTLLIRKTAVKKSKKNLFMVSLGASLAISLIYYLPLAIFSKKILSFWIGDDFAIHACGLVKLLAVVSVLYLFYDAFYNLNQTTGKFKVNACVSVLGAFALTLTLIFFSNHFGINGVAYSYIFMYLCMITFFFVYLFFNKRVLHGNVA